MLSEILSSGLSSNFNEAILLFFGTNIHFQSDFNIYTLYEAYSMYNEALLFDIPRYYYLKQFCVGR